MTTTIIQALYEKAVNDNRDFSVEEKELFMNGKFRSIFVENIQEGLSELPINDLDEVKAAFELARQEAKEAATEEGFEDDARKGLLEEVGIDFKGDITTFMFHAVELLIEVIAEAIGVA